MKQIILAFFLSLTFFNAQANHTIGGEFSYKRIGNRLYEITYKVYRDCSGISICSSCTGHCSRVVNIFGSSQPNGVAHNLPPQTCTNTSYGTATLTRNASSVVYDAVQLCDLVKSVCNNCNTRTSGTFSPGIEVYTFNGTVNLSSIPSSCCWVTIGTGDCCRNSAISTIISPSSNSTYHEIQINTCVSQENSGPVFLNKPSPVTANGGEYIYNLGAYDPDGDSISYRLGVTKTASNTSVPYSSPFSVEVPFPYLGYPGQSPPLQAPSGIQINQQNGTIRFMTVGQFLSNLTLEVLEWRKVNNVPTLLSISSRENQFYSINYPISNLPEIKVYENGTVTNSNSFDVINGSQKCFDIVALSGDSLLNDSTDIEVIHSNVGFLSNMTVTRPFNPATRHINGPKNDTIRVCVLNSSPDLTKVHNQFILVKTRNKICPLPAQNLRVLTLKVYDSPKGVIEKQPFILNAPSAAWFRKTNLSPHNPDSTIWYLETAPSSNIFNIIQVGSDSAQNIVLTQAGFHKLRVSIYAANGSRVNITDSINTKQIGVFAQSISPTICFKDTTARINIQKFGGMGTRLVSLQRFGSSYLPYVRNWQQADSFTNLSAGTYFLKIRDSLNNRDSVIVNILSNSAEFVYVSGNISQINCHGDSSGAVALVFNGGDSFGKRFYSKDSLTWQNSNSFQNLPAGNHTFYVRDSLGCTDSRIIPLTQPSIIKPNLSLSQVIRCKGDTNARISIFPTGGFSPYQSRLNNGNFASFTTNYNNLKPGFYTVEVKDVRGCIQSQSITITEPSTQFVASATVNHPACYLQTGSATITAEGGNKPYQYWLSGFPPSSSPTITNILRGYSTLYARDSTGCVVIFTIHLINPPILSTNATHKEQSCFGINDASISIVGIGGVRPFQYKINNGNYAQDSVFSSLGNGIYQVSLRDSFGCVKNHQITINPKSKIITTFTTTPESCKNAKNGSVKAEISGGKAPYTASWLLNPPINGLQLNNQSTGKYPFLVIDSALCQQVDTALIPIISPFEGEVICGVSVIQSSQFKQITWNKTPDKKVFAHKIYYQTALTTTPTLIANIPVQEPSLAIDSISPKNQLCFYSISSVDSCGSESPLSNTMSAPFLLANKNGSAIDLSWSNKYGPFGLFGYQLYKSTNNNPFLPIVLLDASDSTYTDLLNTNTLSKYYLEALYSPKCSNNFNVYSNEVSIMANALAEIKTKNAGFSLYPNPTENWVKIQSKTSQTFHTIRIYNMQGQLVLKKELKNATLETELDLSNVSKGVYQMLVESDNKNEILTLLVQ